MGLGAPEDLSAEAVRAALPDREVRTFPALLSTEAEALAWARAGAPQGAVVVADYQASPRGRAGLPWQVEAGQGLGFSLVLRPRLPAEREGWLYTAAVCGLADVVGDEAAIHWPDLVHRRPQGPRAAAVGAHVELGPSGTLWAVVTVLFEEARPPRASLLAELVDAIEQRCNSPARTVLEDYRPRCATVGRTVRARLLPMGPGGLEVTGEAVDCVDDGALLINTESGNRVAVRPQFLGILEDVDGSAGEPANP